MALAVAGGLGALAFNASRSKIHSPRGGTTGVAAPDAAVSTVNAPFLPTVENKAPPPTPRPPPLVPRPASPEGMVWIPGGEFSMGCDVASESRPCPLGRRDEGRGVAGGG